MVTCLIFHHLKSTINITINFCEHDKLATRNSVDCFFWLCRSTEIQVGCKELRHDRCCNNENYWRRYNEINQNQIIKQSAEQTRVAISKKVNPEQLLEF